VDKCKPLFFGRDILVEPAKGQEARDADRQQRRQAAMPPPTGCWFCLSNEKDTHLVGAYTRSHFSSA
jgi:hypothetical protein